MAQDIEQDLQLCTFCAIVRVIAMRMSLSDQQCFTVTLNNGLPYDQGNLHGRISAPTFRQSL